jgi:hypothetical protein
VCGSAAAAALLRVATGHACPVSYSGAMARLQQGCERRVEQARAASAGHPDARPCRLPPMCRNIRMLFNFDPPATEEEMRAAARKEVRKVAGTRKPSKANQARFDRAIEAITTITRELLDGLETQATPRSREHEAVRAKARSAKRFRAAAG